MKITVLKKVVPGTDCRYRYVAPNTLGIEKALCWNGGYSYGNGVCIGNNDVKFPGWPAKPWFSWDGKKVEVEFS